MLVSHKMSDVDPAMISSMNINGLFRAGYEGGLTIRRVFGNAFSKIAPNLPASYLIFHLADMGDSFVVAWRPTD